jgi:hypothetical protein
MIRCYERDKKYILKYNNITYYVDNNYLAKFRYDIDIITKYLSIKYDFYANDKNISSRFTKEFKNEPYSIRSNYDIVKYIVMMHSRNLKYASPDLRDNQNIVKRAVASNGFSIKFASKRLQNDVYIIQKAIERSPFVLRKMSNEIRNNIYMVTIAVSDIFGRGGSAFKYASENIKNDKQLLLRLIRVNGNVFKYIKPEFKNDKAFIEQAYDNNGKITRYIPEKFKHDSAFMLDLVKKYGFCSEYFMENFSEKLKNDAEFMTKILEYGIKNIKYASMRLRKDKNFVWTIMNLYPLF